MSSQAGRIVRAWPTLMEKVNQNSAEDRDNASVILLRWDGSTT